MPKPPPPGKCVHCLEDFSELTWDHVIPRGWYPDNTPENIEKWKVPSCKPCNAEYGKIEEEVFTKILLCLAPNNPKAKGLYKKTLRSFDVKCGKDEDDKRICSAKKDQFLRNALYGNDIPTEGFYPEFEGSTENNNTKRMASLIEEKHIHKISEKIIRGMTYIEKKIFIPTPYSIGFSASNEQSTTGIRETLNKFATVLEIPPGVYLQHMFENDNISSVLYIELWGKLKMYAFVEKN